MGSVVNLCDRAGQRLNEAQIAFVVHSVLMGLIYLQSRRICHRTRTFRTCNESGLSQCFAHAHIAYT
jgi:hypothetical protein